MHIYKCFDLPDEGVDDAICDNRAIVGFVRFGLNRETPLDRTTFLEVPLLLKKTI